MKIFKTILLVLASVFILTGCGVAWENGMRVPSDSDRLENAQKRVYIDDSAILENERAFLEEYARAVSEGFAPKFEVFKKEGVETFTPSGEVVDWAYAFPFYASRILMKDRPKNWKEDAYTTNIRNNKENIFRMDLKLEERKLVSTKKYENIYELMLDFYRISQFQFSKKSLPILEKYGMINMVADFSKIDELKLSLIPYTAYYDMKKKAESMLNTVGYKIADDKEEVTDVINLDVLAFTKPTYLSGIKRESSLMTRLPSHDGTFSQFGANIGALGSSSGTVGAIIGATLLVGEIIANNDETNDEFAFVIMAQKEKDGYSYLTVFTPFVFENIHFVSHDFKAKEYANNIGKFGASMEEFLIEGGGRYSSDKNFKEKIEK